VDIANSNEARQRRASEPGGSHTCAYPGRMLKLHLSDGVQELSGYEDRTLTELPAGEFTPAGFKVVVQEVPVRRGMLVLNPDNTKILGGQVDELSRLQKIAHANRASTSSTSTSSDSGSSTLIGMAAVEQVFHFLDGPADVLSAAAACRRWRELACADSVWRARFEREDMVAKARAFEVALPPVPGGVGLAAAGVGLAFYAQIFSLKVHSVRVIEYARYVPSPSAPLSSLMLIFRSQYRSHLCRGTK